MALVKLGCIHNPIARARTSRKFYAESSWQQGARSAGHYSPKYAARTLGSLSSSLPGPVMVMMPDSIT